MADIEMVPVASSNLVAVGYDDDALKLLCQFKNGEIYEWDGVTPDDAAAFLSAPSPGRYLKYEIEAKYGVGVPVP